LVPLSSDSSPNSFDGRSPPGGERPFHAQLRRPRTCCAGLEHAVSGRKPPKSTDGGAHPSPHNAPGNVALRALSLMNQWGGRGAAIPSPMAKWGRKRGRSRRTVDAGRVGGKSAGGLRGPRRTAWLEALKGGPRELGAVGNSPAMISSIPPPWRITSARSRQINKRLRGSEGGATFSTPEGWAPQHLIARHTRRPFVPYEINQVRPRAVRPLS